MFVPQPTFVPGTTINPIAHALALIYAQEKFAQYIRENHNDNDAVQIDTLSRAYATAYERISGN